MSESWFDTRKLNKSVITAPPFDIFSNAYRDDRGDTEVCGLHLAPIAVTPDFQNQGVGSEILRFALRQEAIKEQPLFVLGESDYYRRFGFKPCRQPICPFDKKNAHFLSMRNETNDSFTIGYEAEFKKAEKVPKGTKEPKPPESAKLSSNKSTKGKGSSKRHYSDYKSNRSEKQ